MAAIQRVLGALLTAVESHTPEICWLPDTLVQFPNCRSDATLSDPPKQKHLHTPRIARRAGVRVPPRGTEQPPDSGRETQNPPAPGTESGTPAADPLPELLGLVVELRPEAVVLLLKMARRLRPPPSITHS